MIAAGYARAKRRATARASAAAEARCEERQNATDLARRRRSAAITHPTGRMSVRQELPPKADDRWELLSKRRLAGNHGYELMGCDPTLRCRALASRVSSRLRPRAKNRRG